MRRQDKIKTLEILVERWNEKSPATRKISLSDDLIDFLIQECTIIPNPVYGQIQYELPTDYEFKAVAQRFKSEEKSMLEFIDDLSEFIYHEDLGSIGDHRIDDSSPYWKNSFFSGSDARLIYAIVARLKPRTLLEVGVGHSTRFARRSIQTHAVPCTIKSIDPSPRANIAGVSDEHIAKSVTDVDLSHFARLNAGDVLFFDGSHVSLPGTDVPHMVLNVFPVLKSGVIVHIHDIHLPMEYSSEFRRRQYNEQHMVAAMLLFSEQWDILAPVYYLHRIGALKERGGSLWLRRR